jgi:predicted ATP-grasp superfamily ATP-dependent carboligase
VYKRLDEGERSNIMLQEYIPGGDDTIWMFNGYFDSNSDCRFGITGKKIRQYPNYTGQTSLGVCLRNAFVYETTVRWMKALGYKGILDIGYRYDARDGQYKVLDVNPRIGATFRLFVDQNGTDVARALYLDLTGQPVALGAAREGRKWIVEDADIASFLGYLRDGKLGFAEWLKSLAGIEEAAYFATDDMRPFWKMCSRSLRRKMAKNNITTRRPGKLSLEPVDAKAA